MERAAQGPDTKRRTLLLLLLVLAAGAARRLADGVLFPQGRLTGPGAAPYLAAVAAADPG